MRELILDRISKMENLEERKVLKDILNSVFVNIIDYNEEMFSNLSKEIQQEMEYQENQYTIFSSLVSKEFYDPVDDFLYPICKEDTLEKTYDSKELIDGIKNNNESYLMRVFFECDYLTILDILETKEYEGLIHTKDHSYPIKVQVRTTQVYKEKVNELYQAFIRNGVIWTTLNCPYIEKFVDVYLVDLDSGFTKEETVESIEINFLTYDSYKRMNRIPLWNVKDVCLPSITFPVPADDHVNQQHELSLAKEGNEHGYLICFDESNMGYVKRNENTITVIAPVEEIKDWHAKKVIKMPDDSKLTTKIYELMSNRTRNSFINRYRKQQGMIIRTKAELTRLIQSFEVADTINLMDFRIIENQDGIEESYPVDFFLTDEIRDREKKRILQLDFKATQLDFLTRDKMSFLVSEVQQYFPEYYCEGRLLK